MNHIDLNEKNAPLNKKKVFFLHLLDKITLKTKSKIFFL